MSSLHTVGTSSDGVATVVVVVPSDPIGNESGIARALESAASALRGRSGASGASVPSLAGEEAALMRRVEAEVYGHD